MIQEYLQIFISRRYLHYSRIYFYFKDIYSLYKQNKSEMLDKRFKSLLEIVEISG